MKPTNSSNPCPVCGRPITHGIAGYCSYVCATSRPTQTALEADDTEGTPLDILPDHFHVNATAAVGALAKTVETNANRALAGHPPVNCQLTGEQADALAAMVWGLTALMGLKKGKEDSKA